MPNVVFQINGKKYPLPPSAYTSQVCVSGVGWGEPQAPQALRPPGKSAKLVMSGGTAWRMQSVCVDQPALRGALWSLGPVCGCCSLVLGEMGEVGRTEAWV